jgi:hypothetical protein
MTKNTFLNDRDKEYENVEEVENENDSFVSDNSIV